jgi:pyruvate,water dikinase
MTSVCWFCDLQQGDNVTVGKKCANLGEMTRLNMPVPQGFGISVTLQEQFLKETGALKEIEELLEKTGDLKDVNLQMKASRQIRDIVEGEEMPREIADLIGSYYEDMCVKRGREVAVSVRSAGVKSHPGMYETYLNVKGRPEVLEMVKKVWSSTFNARTIAAQVQHGLPVIDSPCIGVGVVEMVNARCAGVCFTVHPVTGDLAKAMIEANYGLGESVVSGVVSVDCYVVDKESLKVTYKTLGEKKLQIIPTGSGVSEEEVPPEKREAFVISDEEAAEIVKLGKALEAHFNNPQDLEWAIDADLAFPNNIYLLQTRGVVGVEVKKAATTEENLLDSILKKLF